MTSRLFVGTTAGAAGLLAASIASGQGPPPDFRMLWTVEGETTDYNWNDINGQGPAGPGALNGPGPDGIYGSDDDGYGTWQVPGNDEFWTGWNYDGDLAGIFQSGNDWLLEWNCVFNDSVEGVATGGGAFVTANIVVTNSDIITQNFTLLMSLPLTRAILTPLERGSIVGTVTDLTFDDATVSAPTGSQIYTPRIDGADELPGFLLTDPFSESAGGTLQSNTVGPEDFGIPNLVPGTQDANNTIAIFLSFDLTAGDSASFTAIFEVLIPGPGALPLLVAFGLMAGRRRRR